MDIPTMTRNMKRYREKNDYIKFKALCSPKDTTGRVKRQVIKKGKVFEACMTEKIIIHIYNKNIRKAVKN